MNSNPNQILLAIDGSDHALEAVKYVGGIPSFKKMQVLLFHVYSKLPGFYRDRETGPQFDHKMIKEIDALEMQQEAKLHQHMETARQILVAAGFPSDAVEKKLHIEQKGIARDIIHAAKDACSTVVIGRKGVSDVAELVLGGITTKLVEKIDFLPLLVVGKAPKPGKILLAWDGSENAMRAVDYVGTVLGGSDLEVTLVHVIRGQEAMKTGYDLFLPSTQYIEKAKEEISATLDQARVRLIRLGFKPNKVSSEIITGAYSRAVAIYEKAKDEGYGTIVVGRRGLSKVREFFMGRVSNKLIQLAKAQAVWVVN